MNIFYAFLLQISYDEPLNYNVTLYTDRRFADNIDKIWKMRNIQGGKSINAT
jgi:hypothetical protein